MHAPRGLVPPPKLGIARASVVLSFKSVHEGTSNPACVKIVTHVLIEAKHGAGSPCGVALVHHGEATGPTCPVSSLDLLGRVSQSSHGEKKRSGDLGHIVVGCVSQNLSETLAHIVTMAMGECFCEVRSRTPQPTLRPRCINSSSHAACGYSSQGVRWNRTECFSEVRSTKLCANSGCPTGNPRILTPC